MALEDLLAKYGLFAAYLGSVFEGDTVMILAGGLARYGLLYWPASWAMGTLGAVTADSLCFYLGCSGRRTKWASRFAVTKHRISGYGPWAITVARLIPGARVASMLFWGANGLAFSRFLLFDVLGCSLWAATFMACGWALAAQVENLLPKVARIEHRLIVLLAGAVITLLAWRLLLRGWRRSRERPSG
ncbi:MAG: DedA family protein [Candidatus Binatia bacterium]|nr:DedA family protein [Candidatus Binatia bacterium]